MIHAVVHVDAESARIPETAQAIADIPGVERVLSCTGDIDLIAMLRVADHEEIATVVTGQINKLPGVISTRTHIAFATYSRSDVDEAFGIGG